MGYGRGRGRMLRRGRGMMKKKEFPKIKKTGEPDIITGGKQLFLIRSPLCLYSGSRLPHCSCMVKTSVAAAGVFAPYRPTCLTPHFLQPDSRDGAFSRCKITHSAHSLQVLPFVFLGHNTSLPAFFKIRRGGLTVNPCNFVLSLPFFCNRQAHARIAPRLTRRSDRGHAPIMAGHTHFFCHAYLPKYAKFAQVGH